MPRKIRNHVDYAPPGYYIYKEKMILEKEQPSSLRRRLRDYGEQLKISTAWRALLCSIFTIDVPERSPTSWLDGYRGYASFVVSMFHLRTGWTDTTDVGWGTRPQDNNFFQLPIVRLFFSGPSMVAAFYFISGYSLSWGAFKDLQNGAPDKCLARIRSSAFRRLIRLYLPVIWTSVLVLCCMSMGLYNVGIQYESRTNFIEPIPAVYPTLWEQVNDWVFSTWAFLNVWARPRHPYYVHSWSIPVEFDCSMALYISLACAAGIRFRPRVVVLLIILGYVHATGRQYLWTFILGAVVSQLVSRQIHFFKWQDGYPAKKSHWINKAIWTIVLIMGLYCAGLPYRGLESVPYYDILLWYTPSNWPQPYWFWHGIGAMLVSVSASQSMFIQNVFSCRLARFLGRISYGLYLVHGIIIHVVSLRIAPTIFAMTGMDASAGSMQLEIGITLILLIQIPISIVAAIAFTKLFDDSSMQFSKWLESKIMGADEVVTVPAYLPIYEERISLESQESETASLDSAEVELVPLATMKSNCSVIHLPAVR